MVQDERSFIDISYLELLWPFCLAQLNHLYKFGRVHYEEHFCQMILNLDQWFKRRCSLKTYLELWWPLSSAEQNHLCSFGPRHYEEHCCGIIFGHGPVVQKEMSFKDSSYLVLWQPLCLTEWTHLCNFDRRQHEEHFSEIIILNLNKWSRKTCLLKTFII